MNAAMRGFVFALFALLVGATALAGGHTWDMSEVFSDATGTIQFVEVWEANGTPGEVNTAGHDVTSNTSIFTIPSNVAAPTTNKHILLATAGFAALPGAPVPDYIIPSNFFSISGDTLTYVPYDSMTFGAGELPTDGVNSLVKGGATGPSTPTNYAGQSWSPPAVPSGATGDGVTVQKFPTFPDASRVRVLFDTTSCPLGNTDHKIVYGYGSQLPTTLGGTYGLTGSSCSKGPDSPVIWTGVPDPAIDATRFLWFLVLVDSDAATEGAWGSDSAGGERKGPMGGGASGQCSVFVKDPANTCGQ